MEEKKQIYHFIEAYAEKKGLSATSRVLPLLSELMDNDNALAKVNIGGMARFRGPYIHGLLVCRLLVDLVLPVDHEEEDVVLAAALSHILTNRMEFCEVEELFREEGLDPKICEIISLITNDNDLSSEGQQQFYDRILKNRLTLLVFLSDRANLLQQLYNMSIWSANEYIFETRTYFFPLCVQAKELYPELIPTISTLMEKVRTVTDACAILFGRYEKREMELTTDILNLREENARLRGIIQKLEQEPHESKQ